MRSSLSVLIITVISAWAVAPMARAQTAPKASLHGPRAAHSSRRSSSRESRSRSATATTAERSTAAGKADGVTLGATDITGNKELPKVMVIVPWKDSLGAGGVVKPADSLMDEVLSPVDRAVFQRQIRYYGQLNDASQRTPAGQPAAQVAPVGDSR